MSQLIEWSCADCGEVFVTDENVYLHCPECGSYKLSETNQPEPEGESDVVTSA